MFGTVLCTLQKYLISPLLHSVPLPAISSFILCLFGLLLVYLSFQADGAEKWRDRSFNLAYLSPHTFSLCSSSVPSNSSKLPSKFSLLPCCPLLLKSERHHTHEPTPISAQFPRHHLFSFLLLSLSVQVVTTLFSLRRGGRDCLPNV